MGAFIFLIYDLVTETSGNRDFWNQNTPSYIGFAGPFIGRSRVRNP